eukprot:2827582-Prymnesium_polylepis.1
MLSGERCTCLSTRSWMHRSVGYSAAVSLNVRSTWPSSAGDISGSDHTSASAGAAASASASTASRPASRSTLPRSNRSVLNSIVPSMPPDAPTPADN